MTPMSLRPGLPRLWHRLRCPMRYAMCSAWYPIWPITVPTEAEIMELFQRSDGPTEGEHMVKTAIQALADLHDARLSDLAPHWRFRLADGLLAYYKVAAIWLA